MRRLSSRLPRLLGAALLLIALTLPELPADTVVAASDDIKIDEIGRLKRGKENVLLKVDVHGSGLVCQLKLRYADGNADSPDFRGRQRISSRLGLATVESGAARARGRRV